MATKTLRLDIEKEHWKQGQKILAGIDEAGRGPLAGPVVAAAVIFSEDHKPIKGINDSKLLSESMRESLYERIMTEARAVGIGLVDFAEIDKINILNATHKAMRIAIGQTRLPIDLLLVDGRDLKNAIIPQRSIVGGDRKCYSIAAASIIAKVYRDRLMKDFDRIFPQYGFAKHKGYCTKVHCAAIEKYGASPIHRISFKRVNGFEFDIRRITNNRTLGAIGENHAAYYLHQNKYKIVERNYHFSRFGEIDIIANRDNILSFIEVKTLRSESYGLPEEKVDEHKQNQLYKIAEAYLAENALEDMNCRFDIISIMIKNNTFNINHIEDAFQL